MSQNQTQNAVPPYMKLVAQIEEAASVAGVPLRRWELKHYIGFESAVNQHKLYVPKNAGDVSWLHTTLWIDREQGIVQDLPKGPGSIGKIESFVAPDLEVIKARVLPLMTASETRLRANRRPSSRKASGTTPPPASTTPVDFHLGTGLDAE